MAIDDEIYVGDALPPLSNQLEDFKILLCLFIQKIWKDDFRGDKEEFAVFLDESMTTVENIINVHFGLLTSDFLVAKIQMIIKKMPHTGESICDKLGVENGQEVLKKLKTLKSQSILQLIRDQESQNEIPYFEGLNRAVAQDSVTNVTLDYLIGEYDRLRRVVDRKSLPYKSHLDQQKEKISKRFALFVRINDIDCSSLGREAQVDKTLLSKIKNGKTERISLDLIYKTFEKISHVSMGKDIFDFIGL